MADCGYLDFDSVDESQTNQSAGALLREASGSSRPVHGDRNDNNDGKDNDKDGGKKPDIFDGGGNDSSIGFNRTSLGLGSSRALHLFGLAMAGKSCNPWGDGPLV